MEASGIQTEIQKAREVNAHFAETNLLLESLEPKESTVLLYMHKQSGVEKRDPIIREKMNFGHMLELMQRRLFGWRDASSGKCQKQRMCKILRRVYFGRI